MLTTCYGLLVTVVIIYAYLVDLKVLSDTIAQTKVLANKAQFTVPSYLYGGKVLYDYEFLVLLFAFKILTLNE